MVPVAIAAEESPGSAGQGSG